MRRSLRSGVLCSGRLRPQGADADQVVRGRRKDQGPADPVTTTMSQLVEHPNRLHPSEALFDELALPLTHQIPRMARRPRIDRTAAGGGVGILGHMRRDAPRAPLSHKPFRVAVLVPAAGTATR